MPNVELLVEKLQELSRDLGYDASAWREAAERQSGIYGGHCLKTALELEYASGKIDEILTECGF